MRLSSLLLAFATLVSGCASNNGGYQSRYRIGSSEEVVGVQAERTLADKVASESVLSSGKRPETMPTLLHSVLPQMPAEAINQKIEGTVVVEIRFNASGDAEEVKVLSSPHELLATAVVSAIRQWKLAPRYKDGKPVPTVARQSFVFTAR
jgi:TonB family protein